MTESEKLVKKDITFFIICNLMSFIILVAAIIHDILLPHNLYSFITEISCFSTCCILTILIMFTPQNSKEAFGY